MPSSSGSPTSSRQSSLRSLSSMRADRRTSIAASQSHRPQVSRPCEDRRLMQNGKMAHEQLSKHREALAKAVSQKNTNKAKMIRQTIHAMENTQTYLQYRDCLTVMKTYGAANPVEAARAYDRHMRQRTTIANREREEELLGLGKKKRTRKHTGRNRKHTGRNRKHTGRKHKSKTRKRRNRSTKRR